MSRCYLYEPIQQSDEEKILTVVLSNISENCGNCKNWIWGQEKCKRENELKGGT